jgi:fructokinase
VGPGGEWEAGDGRVIASCGEALIDFVPDGDDGSSRWFELLGGSPYNVARGLGRLGAASCFVGAVSTDFFGDELVRGLEDCSVSTEHVSRLERPTTLSFVRLDGGGPSYAFYSAESADRHFSSGDYASLAGSFSAMHFGSNSLVLEPGATAFESLMSEAAGRGLVSLDPNVRPRLIGDRDAYLRRLGRLVAMADVVKLSDEDLAYLEPGGDHREAAARLLEAGPALVVLTSGRHGSTAWTVAAEASAPVRPVPVVDAIGAGDGFMAGLLAFLDGATLLRRSALVEMRRDELRSMLAFATDVAAAVCTRRGAEMPSSADLASLARAASTPHGTP